MTKEKKHIKLHVHSVRDNVQEGGAGGVDKSFTIKKICARLLSMKPRRLDSPVLRYTPTGVAANEINGQTLHSVLRLPVKRTGSIGGIVKDTAGPEHHCTEHVDRRFSRTLSQCTESAIHRSYYTPIVNGPARSYGSTTRGWYILQGEFVSAFLNDDLRENIYIGPVNLWALNDPFLCPSE